MLVDGKALDVAVPWVRWPREPGVRDTPTVSATRVPRNRGAATVASAGVDDAALRDLGIFEPQLLAGIQERGAPQREQQHRGHSRPALGMQKKVKGYTPSPVGTDPFAGIYFSGGGQ